MTTSPSTALRSTTMDSPVGLLTLVASDAGLRAVLWEDDADGRVRMAEVTRLTTTRYSAPPGANSPSTSPAIAPSSTFRSTLRARTSRLRYG